MPRTYRVRLKFLLCELKSGRHCGPQFSAVKLPDHRRYPQEWSSDEPGCHSRNGRMGPYSRLQGDSFPQRFSLTTSHQISIVCELFMSLVPRARGPRAPSFRPFCLSMAFPRSVSILPRICDLSANAFRSITSPWMRINLLAISLRPGIAWKALDLVLFIFASSP